ncbi:probable flavin-containing monooxygenase 1 isoform X2 [Ricinus communis]|uniref:Flavin-containing monooxygenase n=1 Tax=Ricinus communis TaxID=3988 RepID=B9SMR4_RICCO|nr:probable flavin-containing monooxygenase 1 isoform X2 [Ricinus communis]EEF35127.1 dimethylaniline monooxygenase, putative [Ricinus communis]|eukprot:XP_025014558.1 probable flavin-containing monooxygenase 1 isoform X2 [Ricinus communis]
MEKQIAIIGAGISGLAACKYTLSKGFKPIVFEARSSIGGVWAKTIKTCCLQTPKQDYQFSDFPWPDSVKEEFPTQQQVMDYLHSYAKHFDLLKHIKFNSKVTGIDYKGPSDEELESWTLWGGNGEAFSSRGKWNVRVQDNQNLYSQVYQVDFVILCTGWASDVPNVPEFPCGKGPEVFHGKVIHSMDYYDMDHEIARNFLKGKRVTVVGFQKSALDIAMECATENGIEHPCRVLYKTAHWHISDEFPWGVPLPLLYLNRFSELLVHKPGEGFLLSLLATILAPLRWASAKFVESHIKHKHPLEKYGVVPNHGFLEQINSCLLTTLPEKFYDKVEEGSIVLTNAPRFSFCEEGITLDGQTEPLETDIVILATGFRGDKKLQNIFTSKFFQHRIVGSPNAALPLYRECINPRIPQLAVIGYSESLSNMFTSEIRCRWLAELLDGKFKMPSIKEVEKDLENWNKFKKRYAGPYYHKSCIGGLHIWYNDQLCKDMGWNPKRKKGFFAELFEPYGPLDYASP